MPDDDRTFGAIGTKMLFENDRVRIWEVRLAPGDFSVMRRGGIETAVNIGTEDFHEIIVELKD